MNSLFPMLINKKQKNLGTELERGAPSSRREPWERGWCPSATIRHVGLKSQPDLRHGVSQGASHSFFN